MKMKIIVAMIFVAMSIAGCTTTSKIDSAIQANLGQVCSAAETIHPVFIALVDAGKVSQGTAEKELLAYNTLKGFCVDPSTANTTSVLVAVVTNYAVMTRALKEARQT